MTIKFRVWDTAYEKMTYPDDVGNNYLIHPNGSVVEYQDVAANEAMPLLFTGLKDRNGKDIYEGDILHSFHEDRLLIHEIWWTVDWNRYSWIKRERKVRSVRKNPQPEETIRYSDGEYPNFNLLIPDGEGLSLQYEIIGNKWEHPHLLEEGI